MKCYETRCDHCDHWEFGERDDDDDRFIPGTFVCCWCGDNRAMIS